MTKAKLCIECNKVIPKCQNYNLRKYCSIQCKRSHGQKIYDAKNREKVRKRAQLRYQKNIEDKRKKAREWAARQRATNYIYKKNIFTQEGQRCYHQEKFIDDLFHYHNIEHQFQIKIDKYIVDWVILIDNKQFIIEYFGMNNRIGKVGDSYRIKTIEKIKYFTKNNYNFIALYPADFFGKQDKLLEYILEKVKEGKVEEVREFKPSIKKYWTIDEIEILKSNLNLPISELANKLNRSELAISIKIEWLQRNSVKKFCTNCGLEILLNNCFSNKKYCSKNCKWKYENNLNKKLIKQRQKDKYYLNIEKYRKYFKLKQQEYRAKRKLAC